MKFAAKQVRPHFVSTLLDQITSKSEAYSIALVDGPREQNTTI
jgi:hypothetical protein